MLSPSSPPRLNSIMPNYQPNYGLCRTLDTSWRKSSSIGDMSGEWKAWETVKGRLVAPAVSATCSREMKTLNIPTSPIV